MPFADELVLQRAAVPPAEDQPIDADMTTRRYLPPFPRTLRRLPSTSSHRSPAASENLRPVEYSSRTKAGMIRLGS